MKTGIYLSYTGLGANLLHLSYCHQIARKYGPVTIITLCKNLKDALADDPFIENVFYLNQYNKKFFDIFQLSRILKKFNFENLFAGRIGFYFPTEPLLLGFSLIFILKLILNKIMTTFNIIYI